MSTIKDASKAFKEQMIPQILTGCKKGLEDFENLGLHLIDHPIAGLAKEFENFHAVLTKAIAAHDKWHTDKYAPSLPPPEAPVSVNVDIPPAPGASS